MSVPPTTAEQFYQLLRQSGEGFLWTLAQVPPEHRYLKPPGPPDKLGEWSAARHLFHVVRYEQDVVEIMRQWFDGHKPELSAEQNEEADWGNGHEWEYLVSDFQNARQAQLDLIAIYDESSWDKVMDTLIWGHHPLRWLVTKTFQHTAEHTNYILQIVLRWDIMEERYPQEPASQSQ